MAEPLEQWCVIRTDQLLRFLARAHDGEDPDLLLLEVFANSRSERY